MVRLTVHALSEICVPTLTIAAVLAGVVGVVWVGCIVRVSVRVVARMSWLTMRLLHVLTLLLRCRSARMLTGQRWGGGVVAAILRLVVSRLRRLLRLTLGKGRVVGTCTESTATTLLSDSGFLLARSALLAIVAVILLVCGRALLFGSWVLRPKGFWGRRKPADLGLRLLHLLLTGVIILAGLRRLLAKWIVRLLRGCRGLRLTVTTELVIGLLALRALVLHCL